MELLLTGSTGFVGRNLLLKLLADARWKRLHLPVRSPEKLHAQLKEEGITPNDRLHIFPVSGDTWELPPSVKPDLTIHAAGHLFGRTRQEYFSTNVTGSLNLVARLPETSRIIVLSSLAAGGPTPPDQTARKLEDRDSPVSLYGASKLAMEQALRAHLGSRLLLLRPPMVLGPRDGATLPLFQMAKGFLWMKPGFAKKHYSWIAVDDLCEALLTASTAEWPADDNLTFYLAGNKTISDTQLLTTAAEVIKRKGIVLPVPQFVIHAISLLLDIVPDWREAAPSLGRDRVREILPSRWVADGRDFSQKFAWKPHKEFTETLRATAEWLKARGKI